MYQPAEHILWDAWFVEVDGIHHAYYLQAPKGLADPEQRHTMAEVGHAVSRDLVTWEERGTAFSQGRPGSFDDGSVWSGSVGVHDGLAHFFYTGISRAHGYTLQRIGHAVSDDLDRFVRVTTEPILDADPAWYETTGGPDGNLHWRDPIRSSSTGGSTSTSPPAPTAVPGTSAARSRWPRATTGGTGSSIPRSPNSGTSG